MDSISVIIPVYNRHDTIYTAIKSIYAQKWNKNKLEIILSDDNSDKPFDYLLEEFPDLKIIRATINRGAGVARQRGLDIATGTWVTFLDADDEFNIGFFDVLKENNKGFNILQVPMKIKYLDGKEYIIDNGIACGYVHGSIYKLSFLKNNNIRFDDKLRIHEDSYFQRVVIKYASNTIYHSDKYGYIFNINENSTTYRLGDDWNSDYQMYYSRIKYLIKCDTLISLSDKQNQLSRDIYRIFNPYDKNKDVELKREVIDPNLLYIYFNYMEKYLKLDTWDKIKNIIEDDIRNISYIDFIKSIYDKYKNRKEYTLSIIIPAYNSHSVISKTVNNLYKQLGRYIDYTEVIITDDNSDNPNYDYLKENHKNLRILNNTENVKQGLNRNRGINAADGKWVCFLDHDDEGFTKEAFDDFFSIENKNILYNIIWGKCLIEEESRKSNSMSLGLTHGKFYKKSFLDSYQIRFSKHLYTSEDYYFNQRAMFSVLEKRKNPASILFIDKIYYVWSYNKDSVFRSKYNNREALEEFFNEHIFSSLLVLEDGFFSEKLWKMVLLQMVIDTCNYLGWYKTGSKNFKKSNIKYLCGILIILNKRFNVSLKNFDEFFNKYIDDTDELYTKYSSGGMNRNFDRTFLEIAYNMILRMSIKQMEELENEFKSVGIDITKTEK